MKKAFTRAMTVCAVLLIGVGILAILNEPEIEPATQQAQPAVQPMQPAQPAAQSEPLVKQEQAQTEQAKLTEQAKPTEPPAKRDLRNGDHATVKMKTFACKTMAYFDRWVALMIEGSCRSEGREGRRRGRAPEGRGRPRPGQVSGHPPWCADEDVLRWFILVVALLLDPAAVRRVSGRPSCCEALLRLRRRRTLARLEAHGEATSSGWIHRQSQTSPALRRAQGLLTSTA